MAMSLKQRELHLDNQVCFALHAASRAMTRTYGPLLEPLGLTYPQYVVLLVLWEQDDVSVTEIGERLSLDSGTLTPLLKRMEANGLLTRTRSARDERQVDVRLTAHGKRLRARAAKIRTAVLCSTTLSEEAGAALLASLQKLLEALAPRLDSVVNPNRKKKALP